MSTHDASSGRDDLNEFDCDGYRPIHHAILAGFIDGLPRARDLINAGAMLNAPTESGDGALVLLCKALRDAEAVLWVDPLLEWGAELIDRDKKGWSALHHAVSREMIETIKKLMEAGADPFLRAVDGTRPVDLIAKLANSSADIRELLKTR
jgi:ankyrin repeat protein